MTGCPTSGTILQTMGKFCYVGVPSWMVRFSNMFVNIQNGLEETDDPVNIVHGNMRTFPQTDFELSGINEPLPFYRTYHSQSEYDGPLGYGWTHNLNVTITRRGTYLWEIMDGEGRFHFFAKQSVYDPDYDNLSYDGTYLTDEAYVKNTWVAKDGTKYNFPYVYNAAFNTPYRVTSIEYPDGNAITFLPSDGSLPTTITNTHNRTITIAYSGGRISTIHEPGRPAGELIQYAYLGGNLTSVTYPVDASTDLIRQYVYNDPNDLHNLTEIIDERGNSFNYVYDTSDRCYQSYGESLGGGNYYETALVYDPPNNRTTVTRVRGTQQFNDIYTYSDMGYIVQIDHQESGITEQYTHNLVFHDIDSEYTQPGIPEGTSTVEKLVTDGSDHYKKIWHLDGNYNVIDVVEGKVPTVNDDPTGTAVEMTYDGAVNFNYLVNINDQRGVNLEFQYGDGQTNPGDKGKLTLLRKHNDSAPGVYYEINTMDYNSDGTLNTVTDARGKITSLSYDANGVLIGIDPAGEPDPVSYERDGAGRVTRITQKNDSGTDRVTDIASDWLGRITQITYPTEGGSRLTVTYDHDATDLYDPAASCGVNVINTSSIKTQYLYNAAGLLWKVVRDRDGATPAVTEVGYDAYGNLVSLIDPENQITTYEYDSLDRLTKTTENGQTYYRSFTYYPDGSLKSRTDQNGATTQYTYDSDNRLYQVSYPDASSLTYTYEPNGLLASVQGATGTIAFAYDDVNRLTSTNGALTGAVDPDTVAYDYHPDGQIWHMTSARGATTYDLLNDRGALWKITNPNSLVTEYAYNQYTGAPSRVTNHGNGTYTDYDFDNLDRLDSYTTTIAAGSFLHDYTYHDSNLIDRITFPTGNFHEFDYDNLDRVTTETLDPGNGNPATVQSYQYDLADNRTGLTGVVNEVYTIDPGGLNQIDAVTTVGQPSPYTSFGYDNNGNMTLQYIAGTPATYVAFDYDYENRLIKMTYTDDVPSLLGSTEFVYDPLGRRLKTIERDASDTIFRERHYVYDGLDMIAELDANGAVVASYTHGPGIDDPIIMRLHVSAAAGDYFYHKNHQGSITEITTASGQIAKMYRYDAYGKKYFESGPPLIDEPAYTARDRHDRTGLYYYRNRFYYPQIGRFLTQDPIGMLGGTNLYAYTGNNPVNWVDPLGLYVLVGADVFTSIKVPRFSNSDEFAKMIDTIPNTETRIIIAAHGEPGGIINVSVTDSSGKVTYNKLAGEKLYGPLIAKAKQMPDLKSIDLYVCSLFDEEAGKELEKRLKKELPGVEITGFDHWIPQGLLFYGLAEDYWSE
jgi:RHS repeat-associated protein